MSVYYCVGAHVYVQTYWKKVLVDRAAEIGRDFFDRSIVSLLLPFEPFWYIYLCLLDCGCSYIVLEERGREEEEEISIDKNVSIFAEFLRYTIMYDLFIL